jgi:general secretion pathway protein F
MQFAVRTLAPDMTSASVVVDAPSEAAARRLVEARGLYVSAAESARGPLLCARRAGKLLLVLFSQELLALFIAGVGIVEGMEALLEKEGYPATRAVPASMLKGRRFSSALAELPALYDGEIGRWIDRFTPTFEPLLMAAIGLVVGAIVVLLYMPIFDLAGDMS